MSLHAADRATIAEIEQELEALRGQGPPGAELVDDPAPKPMVVDPLTTTVAIALVVGIAGGAGKILGEQAMHWLIDKIKSIVSRRKANVNLTVAGLEVNVDEHTDTRRLAAQVARAVRV
ncbi:MAG TPA: hypothetical protein VFU23_03515 [Gemmatimonadales bacterium]|nr:hypothetical protein [Gemmatimonadales bacterium]